MTKSIDLQARVNGILAELFDVVSGLQELREQGLDDQRAHRAEGFAEILNATWGTMLDYFGEFPDLKAEDLMSDEEHAAYLRGHGVLMFRKPKTED